MPDNTGRAQLARRYRRLLWTYPRSYRRRNGAEMVTTLLDAAPDDRARPTRQEVVDLLTGGIRFRFRVRGAAAALAAVSGAVCAAVAVGAFGGFLGWQTAPSLPSDADATMIAQPALPSGATAQPQRWDFLFDDDPGYTDPRWAYWLAGTDAYEHGQVFFDVPYAADVSSGAVARDVEEARQRLRAAGWRLTATRNPATGARPAAYRDGWRVEMYPTYSRGDSVQVLRIAVTRDAPGAVLPLTTVGLLVGGIAGWLLVAWAYRRGRETGPLRRAAAMLLFGGGVLALFPATAMSAAALACSYLFPHDLIPAWSGYAFVFFRALAWLGAIGIGAAYLVSAAPANRQREPVTG